LNRGDIDKQEMVDESNFILVDRNICKVSEIDYQKQAEENNFCRTFDIFYLFRESFSISLFKKKDNRKMKKIFCEDSKKMISSHSNYVEACSAGNINLWTKYTVDK
jgi:hypothetical protein